jgi:outer membrane murein-binding lipoprotein Lpp
VLGLILEAAEPGYGIVAWAKKTLRLKRERTDWKELAELTPIGEMPKGKESRSEPPNWIKWVDRTGLFLVVLGVIGELWFGIKLDDKQNDIHTYDVQLIGDAKKAADGAIEDLTVAQSKLDQVASEVHDVEKEAAQLHTDVAADTKKIDATIARLEQAQQQFDLDELRLAAIESGHTFWYQLFSSLKNQRPARMTTIICQTGASRETRLFAEKLAVVLSDFKWPSGVAPTTWNILLDNTDVTIQNKFVEAEMGSASRDPNTNEPDHTYMLPILKVKIGQQDAERLARLSVSLGADVKIADDLDENSFRILIANSTKKK